MRGCSTKHPGITIETERFSPNGKRLVTPSLDGLVKPWEIEGTQLLGESEFYVPGERHRDFFVMFLRTLR